MAAIALCFLLQAWTTNGFYNTLPAPNLLPATRPVNSAVLPPTYARYGGRLKGALASAGADGHHAADAELYKLLTNVPQRRVSTVLAILAELEASGIELLSTELWALLDRHTDLQGLASSGDLPQDMLEAGVQAASFSYMTMVKDILPSLEVDWGQAVKKWRQKALAVEKYRTTQPAYVASIYTWMANICLRRGRADVAYDALAYSGCPPAGPFFVRTTQVQSLPAVVLNLDSMATYIAEHILDMDLDAWRQKAGDTSGAGGKRMVGVEESNFMQGEDSVSHTAALRVRDMTLATARVALRRILQNMKDGREYEPGSGLLIVAGCKTGTAGLAEILLPRENVQNLLAIDLALPPSLCTFPRFQDVTSQDLQLDRGQPLLLGGEGWTPWLAQFGSA